MTYMPFVRLEPGKYLIGVKERRLIVKNAALMIKIGDRFINFHQFVQEHNRQEGLALHAAMKKENGSMKEVVRKLLQKHRVDRDQIRNYERNLKPEVGRQFEELVQIIKEGNDR